MNTGSIQTFAASDGYPLRYRCYEPSGQPRATLIGIHGIQSHGGWYGYSSTKLCDAGFRVLYFDRRGSGLNEQARGDTPTFGRLLDDLAECVRSLAAASPAHPGTAANRGGRVFLAAVSWGGKLAVALQRREEGLVDGLMLLCPGLFPQVAIAPWTQLGILGARLISPQRLFPIPLDDPELFTTSPRWREFIHADPLALHQATARFFVESYRLDRYLRKAPGHVKVPVLLLLAGQDRIIRNDKTQRFFQKFATAAKNVITYGEAHHTLEFEPDPDRFVTEMVKWLDRQCR